MENFKKTFDNLLSGFIFVVLILFVICILGYLGMIYG